MMNIPIMILLTFLFLQIERPSDAMEATDADITPQTTPPPYTFRISYFCPCMTVAHDVSYVIIKLPDNTKLETKGWYYHYKDGLRHTLYHRDNIFPTLTLQNNDHPYQITVYPMTGYLKRSQDGFLYTECYEPISLILDREKITADLDAIQITHSKKSVEDMWINYRYKDQPFNATVHKS